MKTIPLTQGQVALVDDADYEAVSQFKWCAMKNRRGFYAGRGVYKTNGKHTVQYLHQFLLPGVSRIDHRDGNGLNNRRHNLRPATNQQNLQGARRKKIGATSRFRGVSWFSQYSKWQASIKVNGKPIHLGYHEVEAKAAKAYDVAARKYCGDFASPNFP